LETLASRKAASLSAAERKAASIAQAMLPEASVLLAEMPLSGLETADARKVLELLARVCRSRAVIATAARTDPASPERELVLGADQAAILTAQGGRWVGQPGSLMHGGRLFAVTLDGDGSRFAAGAADQGVELLGDYPHYTARLPEGSSTAAVLKAAALADSTVLDLVPLWD
jgi:energy-coupling factor transporter ATP-binding protein EcfA2